MIHSLGLQYDTETGQLRVEGTCVQDKVLAFGLMELAKVAIANPQASPLVKPAPGAVIPNLRLEN